MSFPCVSKSSREQNSPVKNAAETRRLCVNSSCSVLTTIVHINMDRSRRRAKTFGELATGASLEYQNRIAPNSHTSSANLPPACWRVRRGSFSQCTFRERRARSQIYGGGDAVTGLRSGACGRNNGMHPVYALTYDGCCGALWGGERGCNDRRYFYLHATWGFAIK